MKTKAKWTFMVYMAGDNTLSSAGDVDLKEMRKVGSTTAVNIVAQFDNAGNSGTMRYLILKGGENEPSVKLNETDCGSPDVLNDFISWAALTYPAERYALILWSHGNGWQPTELDRIAMGVKSPQYNSRELARRSSSSAGKIFFRTTWKQVFRLPSPAMRAICVDDGSGHSLDTVELGNVLESANQVLGQPIDLLGMDACLMCNLEVAYQVRSHVKYIVGSEESEPNNGWPYDKVLQKLVDHPDLHTSELALHIVDSYVKSYQDIDFPDPVTQAALDLSRIDNVTKPLDRLARLLIEKMKTVKIKIRDAQFESAHFYDNTLWDIADFSEQLVKHSRDKDLVVAVSDLNSVLNPDPMGFIISENHFGSAVSRCKGLSIYLPMLTDVSRSYSELRFAQQHLWAEMLKAYHIR
jgi:hypothetical protein